MHHFDSLASLAEVTAVKSHFRAVLWLLRQRRPPGLDPAQKVARALLLDELEGYAARGIFPLNTHSPGERRPTFIDEIGTRCAVAHLLDISGEESLALEVRDRMNFATVSEIVEEPRFVAWLEAAGFTREEIALVQPAYQCTAKVSECMCNRSTIWTEGRALVTYRSTDTGATVTEVHRGIPGVEVGLRVVSREEAPGSTVAPSTKRAGNHELLGWVRRPMKNLAGETYAIIERSIEMEDGSVSCSEIAPSLPKEQAIEALLSPSVDACSAYLASIDDDWDDSACGSGGCDMSNLAGSSAESLAVLAAIVGAIAARRRGSR